MNVGGCVIPVLISLYILIKYDLWVLGAVGTAIVAVITHQLATPVHGVGIALPIFVPPIVTAIVAVLLSRPYAGPLAYVSGSLGVLIGADLSNLSKVASLGAPGSVHRRGRTFDGIFLTGVLRCCWRALPGRAPSRRSAGRRRHCEKQSDEAIQFLPVDCFAPLAMTESRLSFPLLLAIGFRDRGVIIVADFGEIDMGLGIFHPQILQRVADDL